MKRFQIACAGTLVLTAAIGRPDLARAQVWEPIGPTGARVFSMARHPVDPRVVYAGTYFGGLYVSSDAGFSWEHVAGPFSNKVVFSIGVSDAAPDVVYAATFEAGVFRSDDRGDTWSARNSGLSNPSVLDIAVSDVDPDHVIAATAGGLFWSSDGGGSWAAAVSGTHFDSVVFADASAQVAFAGTVTEGVLRSLDGGQSWAPYNVGLVGVNVTSLDRDPLEPEAVYASTLSGVFVLAPGTATWQDITYNLPADELVNQVYARPQDAGLLASTSAGVYRLPDPSAAAWVLWADVEARLVISDATIGVTHIAGEGKGLLITGDDAQTFFPATAGIQNAFVGALATIDAGGVSVIYAGTDAGVQWTSEFFKNGNELPWIDGLTTAGTIFGVTPVPSALGTLFAGSERNGAWRSVDWGSSWTSASEGLVPSRVHALAQSPVGARTAYAATSSGLFYSEDDGASWAPYENSVVLFAAADVAVDPERPGVAWFGTFDGQVYRTFDGRSFHPTWRHPEGHAIRQIAPSRWAEIYLVTASGELFASQDVGGLFVRRADGDIPEQITSAVVDPERPWVVYVGTVFGGVYKSESSAIAWETQNTGLDVPIISSLAIDPSDAETLYAGSIGAVYKTTSGGDLWTKTTAGLPAAMVLEIEVDPADSTRLLASVENAGLYRSIDAGQSWSPVGAEISSSDHVPFAAATGAASTWLAGGPRSGVWRSADDGSNWTQGSSGMSLFVRSIAAHPSDPETLYAGTLSAGVFRTDDGGDNWVYKGLDDRNVLWVATAPLAPSTVYAGTTRGVSRSDDDGETWRDIGTKPAWVYDAVVDPLAPQVIYAFGIFGQLFRSADAGASWEQIALQLPQKNLLAGALDAQGRLIIGTEGAGVFAWTPSSLVDLGFPVDGSRVLAIATAAFSPTLLVATNGEGLWRSVDGGAAWARVSAAAGDDIVAAVAVDPFNDNRALAAVRSLAGSGTSLFVSNDGGETWAPTTLAVPNVTHVEFSRREAGHIYVAADSGVFRSEDSGASWVDFGAGLQGLTVTALGVDPNVPRLVLAGDNAGGLYYSVDHGAWQPAAWQLDDGQPGSVSGFAFGSPGVAYAANLGGGLPKSVDGGRTWQGGAASGLQSAPVLSIAIHPSDPLTLFAATGGLGLLKSVDGGSHWQRAAGVANFLLAVTFDPENPERVYAGATQEGVFVSDDGGATWGAFNDGLFNRTVTSIAVDAADNDVVYAGTEGGGLYRVRRN